MAKKEKTIIEAVEAVTPVAPVAEPVASVKPVAPVKPVSGSGFYIYIGPNIKGLIQTGTIYIGSRDEAYEKASKAIAANPAVKTLIVSGTALPEARLKVKKPGNALYASYQKLAGK